MNPEHKSSQGSSICVGCGLCCDGTLFDHAKVAPAEAAQVIAAGLEVFERKGKTVFRQPCPHARYGKCSIYGNRPDVCRTFRCELLRRKDADLLSHDVAKETIQTAIGLLQAVVTVDPVAGAYRERKRIRAELAAELASVSAEQRKAIAERLLNMVALDEFLNRHFRRKKVGM